METSSQISIQTKRQVIQNQCKSYNITSARLTGVLHSVTRMLHIYDSLLLNTVAAEITPTFCRSIKIKRNKVHKKFFYL